MIEVKAYEGEGMSRVYENEKWMVGLKNWKPANDRTGLDCLERHNKTDELFILLAGRCTLLYGTENGDKLDIVGVEMEPLRVYNIPAGLWHNTVTQRDTKLALIEDVSTGMDNSDIRDLSAVELEQVQALLGE